MEINRKGDEAPSDGAVTDYVAQVRSYMGAFGASRGLLVFLTTGEVREVTA